MKQKLIEIKGGIGNSTTTVGDFNIPIYIMKRTIRQKMNKEIKYLNNSINQLDLIYL